MTAMAIAVATTAMVTTARRGSFTCEAEPGGVDRPGRGIGRDRDKPR